MRRKVFVRSAKENMEMIVILLMICVRFLIKRTRRLFRT